MEELELCPCNEPHSDIVLRSRAHLPGEELLYDLADLFKLFADSTRIKILYALFPSELCVCDIAELLGLTQSAISHQLRLLKHSKLVRARRDGRAVYYALADDHVRSIIGQGMDYVEESSKQLYDSEALV